MARRINFENPETLNYVRVGYVTTQLVILGIYYYVSVIVSVVLFFFFIMHMRLKDSLLQVKRKNDQTVLKYG